MAVAAANELVFLFVGLELVSMPTYLLLYLSRRSRVTQEAAVEGTASSSLTSSRRRCSCTGWRSCTARWGISNPKAMGFLFDRLANASRKAKLAMIAVIFVIAGLAVFASRRFRFIFYAPDVYQGSPIVIAAVLSWVPKAVGFLAIVFGL